MKIKKGEVLQNTKMKAEALSQNIGLHTVFVTASPVLTNEVKRYYQKLTMQIQIELKKRELRRQQKLN